MIASQPPPVAPPTAHGSAPGPGLPPSFTSFVAPITLRLRDIASFQLPRLAAGASGGTSASASTQGSSSSSSDTSSPSASFAAYETELNDSLHECASLIQEGQILVEDLCTDPTLEDSQVGWIQSEWARVTEQFQRTRSSARTELLQARRTLAERKKQGLLKTPDNALPAGTLGPEQSLRQRQQADSRAKRSAGHTDKSSKGGAFAGDDEALLASSSLTSSLHASLSLLSDSLSQSTYSAQLLDESSASLSSLSLSYSTFSDLLKNSGSIIRSMEKQDRIDALMLLGAYAFFLLCVGYILKVRIWDRGIGVLWFFLRMFGIVGKAGGGTAAPATTTAAKHLTESILAAANASSSAAQVAQEAATAVSEAVADTAATSTAAGVMQAVSTALAGAATTAAVAAASSGLGQLGAQPVVVEGEAAVSDNLGAEPAVVVGAEPDAEPVSEPEPAAVVDTETEPHTEGEAPPQVEEVHVEVLDSDAEAAGADADEAIDDGTIFYDAKEEAEDDGQARAQDEAESSDAPEEEVASHAHDEL